MNHVKWLPMALCVTLLWGIGAMLPGVAGAATSQPGRSDLDLAGEVRGQFSVFCNAVDDPASGPPDLVRAPTWLSATNERWVFVIDMAGNRSFRRLGAEARTAAMPPYPAARMRERPWVLPGVRDRLFERTRRLAADLAQVREGDGQAHLKQEVVLICRKERDELLRYGGRHLVRLSGLPRDRYFQVVFGPDQRPVRVDTNVRNPACVQLADAISGAPTVAGSARHSEVRGPLVFGTFFYPTHTPFELNAYSYEGEDFLNVPDGQNPFRQDHFVADPAYPPQTAAYRRSQDYRRWCWAWWDSCGRVGAIRGNWDGQAGKWEHSGVAVRFHRSLADYPLKGSGPREMRKYVMMDGKEHEFPFAVAEEFGPAFYQDLERCHVVYISTHGGNLGRRFRLQRNLDVWVKFDPPQGQMLGSGSLRHLFFEGCGSMTYLAEGDGDVLVDSWIRNRSIEGIRTISGNDGGHTALDRSGWHFYGRYNKGDSISDAWALGNLDENVKNNPVTIAYGQTRQEAIKTLISGRFTTQEAGAKWAAMSLWEEVFEPPAGRSPGLRQGR